MSLTAIAQHKNISPQTAVKAVPLDGEARRVLFLRPSPAVSYAFIRDMREGVTLASYFIPEHADSYEASCLEVGACGRFYVALRGRVFAFDAARCLREGVGESEQQHPCAQSAKIDAEDPSSHVRRTVSHVIAMAVPPQPVEQCIYVAVEAATAFNVVQLHAITLVEQARVNVPVPVAPRDTRFVASTHISASGRNVAVTRNDSVLLFDTLTFGRGSGSGYLTLNVNGACCSAFSPDERLLAVAGRFQSISYFDMSSISVAAAATASSECDLSSAALLHSEPPLRTNAAAPRYRPRVLGLIYVPPSYRYIEWVSQTHVVAVTMATSGGSVDNDRRTVDLISVPLQMVQATYLAGGIHTAGFSRDRRSIVLLDSQVTASVVCLRIAGSELAPVAEDESSIVLDEAALAQAGAPRDGKKCLIA